MSSLHAVLAVAQTGSFVEASTILGISSAAISKAISRFEQELGAKIFQRTTRRVALTPEGQRLVNGLRPIMHELDALTEEIKDATSEPTGLLRLSVPPTFGRQLLMPLIDQFLSRYPQMSLDISLDPKLSNLIDDKIDMAVRAGALPDSANLVARPVIRTRTVLCASKAYLEKHSIPDTPDDLQKHHSVLLRNPGKQSPQQWQISKSEYVDVPPTRLVVDDYEALASAIRQGIGIGRLIDFISLPLIEKGELVELLPLYQSPKITLNAIYNDRRLVSPRIRAMIDFLVEHLSQ